MFLCLSALVAPFTGAWIETERRGFDLNAIEVAPFTGAWIETNYIGQELETV